MPPFTPPESFLWGVATSGYQAEGGFNGPGQPRTNWAEAEEAEKVAKVGASAAFLDHYAEDFARCTAMGLNAFRLGIEWSRIQPVAPGAGTDGFDEGALDRYAAMLAAAREAGLEPVVTLHHFVHPAWLGADAWLDPATPGLFEAYVRRSVEGLNQRLVEHHRQTPVWLYLTVNEPNMLVLNTYLGRQFPGVARSGLRTCAAGMNQLLRAHVLAYNAVHDLHERHGWRTPGVTLNNYCSDVYWSDKMLLDLLASRERGVAASAIQDYVCDEAEKFAKAFATARIPLHRDLPWVAGSMFKRAANWLGRRRFHAADFASLTVELERSPRARVFDFLALDYYDPFAAHAFRLPRFADHEFRSRSLRAWMMSAVTSKWWDWRVLPRGLHFFCEHFSQSFDGRAVLIAENGMALRNKIGTAHAPRRDGMTRSQFLRLHVHETVRLRQQGVPVFGYLHWSLFDNYEWGSFAPRFGLFSLDFAKGAERLVETPDGDRPSETYTRLVAEARSKLAEPTGPRTR